MCRITFRKMGLVRGATINCDEGECTVDCAIEIVEQVTGWTFGGIERCLRWERDFGYALGPKREAL
jgi:hypothetical protein